VHVVLTPQGRAVLGQAIAAHIDGIDRHLMAHLDDTDRAALATVLHKLLDAGC
jgi:DNA-binding MarR family transcriptional regulator